MEYNLLKTIEPVIGGITCPNEMYPRLTSFPAADYVNPGVGQISRLYSFYVPLYNKESTHMRQKKVNVLELEGSGSAEITQEEPITETNEIKMQLQTDPETFNEMKRKRMGSPIHESFLHPKIKTDKIVFEKPKKTKKSTNTFEVVNEKSGKPVKHKFVFE